jgi:hypothetical protein
MAGCQIGDKVRVILVPPYLYTDNPVDKDTARFFERCLGKTFRVEDFDEYGQLELWVMEDGSQAPDSLAHTIWIEPEYAEPTTETETPTI